MCVYYIYIIYIFSVHTYLYIHIYIYHTPMTFTTRATVKSAVKTRPKVCMYIIYMHLYFTYIHIQHTDDFYYTRDSKECSKDTAKSLHIYHINASILHMYMYTYTTHR